MFSNDSSLALYLREIAKYKLLTAAQEKQLGEKIRAATIEKQKVENKSLDIIASGEQARELLIHSNLRLVVSIARKYYSAGFDLLDIIQEGNIGLLEAVTNFDSDRGTKFSTYATWIIRQRIYAAFAKKSSLIKLSTSLFWGSVKLERAREDLQLILNRDPTVAELAAQTGLSEKVIRRIATHVQSVLSLDTVLQTEEDEVSTIDIIEDPVVVEEQLEKLFSVDEQKDLLSAIHMLSLEEQLIIKLFYGIDEDTTFTFQEISDLLGRPVTSIRKIKSSVIKKLRAQLESSSIC